MQEVFYEQNSDNNEYIYFRYVEAKSSNHFIWIKPHFHNALEIKVVAKGSLKAYSNGKEYTINEGDMFFVSSLSTHYYKVKNHCHVYDIVFDENFFNKACEKGYVLPTHMKKNDAWDTIEMVLRKAWDAGWSSFSLHQRHGFIYCFLGAILQYFKPIKTENKINAVMLKVMQYVEENYVENITIELLANKFGYNKAHFSNIFHKFLGINFRDYLNRIRITAARSLKKEEPELPEYVIAEKVGFTSWSTYKRAYNKFIK